MTAAGFLALLLPVGFGVYAYVAYPGLLWLRAMLGRRPDAPPPTDEWPMVTISVPVYNEEQHIEGLVESLLGLDYPAERRHILIISDASTDGTDSIVERFADRGVELLRLPRRVGKTGAEAAGTARLRGDIVINTDATVRIDPHSIRPLVHAFEDPSVGVASGRDVSVGATLHEANRGESGYVGYEMWVRDLETRVGSIVGASGCFYAIRRRLHEAPLPDGLSRDFAAALVAREEGFRAVSVRDAVCYVPRTASLRREHRRKVRTMARGLQTLWHKRALLSPTRYGAFAFMLFSHKLARWLVPATIPIAFLGWILVAPGRMALLAGLGVGLAGVGLGVLGRNWPPRWQIGGLPGAVLYGATSLLAGCEAWLLALRGRDLSVWEPTRRPQPSDAPAR